MGVAWAGQRVGGGRSAAGLPPRVPLLLLLLLAGSPRARADPDAPAPQPAWSQAQLQQQFEQSYRRQHKHFEADSRGRPYDRSPMAGRARGARAGGQPDPVPGLAAPEGPALSPLTASMEDLVLPFGYPLESYPVETGDGFILRMYRIPRGARNATAGGGAAEGPRPAVILHHGVTLASNCFVVMDPESSMGFYLADAGFDVWMVNTRGNTYSRGHRRFKSTDVSSYWAFSMDDLALVDLATQIDFVLSRTGLRRAAFAGHSQGGTLALMLLAARPEYNSKVSLLMLLGALHRAELITAPFLRTQAAGGSANLLRRLGSGQFLANTVTSPFVDSCEGPAVTQMCFELFNFLFYGPSKAVDGRDFPRVAATWPATVGASNLVHWTQMRRAQRGLAMFDFGTDCGGAPECNGSACTRTCNQAKYGTEQPPLYDLSRITAPSAVLEGDNDMMAVAQDAALLIRGLGAKPVYHKIYPETAHMDFVWARRPIMKADIINMLWATADVTRAGG